MRIAQDTVVSLHYTLTIADGRQVDSSQGGDPLLYLHGRGQIIPGLENALAGKEVGASFTTTIAAAEGYGVHETELDLSIPLESFPAEQRHLLRQGARFEGPHPSQEDRTVLYTVHEIEGDQVLCSGNHELAGKDLTFAVEVVAVRAATPTELAHGHAHGPGGHHHH